MCRFLFLFIFLKSQVLWAVEGSENSEGAASTASNSSKKVPEEEDWAKQIGVLNSKEGQVRNFISEIKELIKKKNSTSSKKEKSDIIDQMIKVYNELKEEAREFNSVRDKIKYRFPDKGDLTERRYLPMKVQPLETMEQEMGLDASLTHIKNKVNKKYKKFLDKELYSKQEKANRTQKNTSTPEATKHKTIIIEK